MVGGGAAPRRTRATSEEAILLGFLLSNAWNIYSHPNIFSSTNGWRKRGKSRDGSYVTLFLWINTLLQSFFGTRFPAVIKASYTYVPTTLRSSWLVDTSTFSILKRLFTIMTQIAPRRLRCSNVSGTKALNKTPSGIGRKSNHLAKSGNSYLAVMIQ